MYAWMYYAWMYSSMCTDVRHLRGGGDEGARGLPAGCARSALAVAPCNHTRIWSGVVADKGSLLEIRHLLRA